MEIISEEKSKDNFNSFVVSTEKEFIPTEKLFCVREETIMIPFQFKVQQKNSNGAFTTDVISQIIDIPCNYAKFGNSIILAIEIQIAYDSNYTFGYSYKKGNNAISIELPSSYVGSNYRWIAETKQVPKKYQAWDFSNILNTPLYGIDNRDKKEYEWLWVRINSNTIKLYCNRNEGGDFITAQTYFGLNAD